MFFGRFCSILFTSLWPHIHSDNSAAFVEATNVLNKDITHFLEFLKRQIVANNFQLVDFRKISMPKVSLVKNLRLCSHKTWLRNNSPFSLELLFIFKFEFFYIYIYFF